MRLPPLAAESYAAITNIAFSLGFSLSTSIGISITTTSKPLRRQAMSAASQRSTDPTGPSFQVASQPDRSRLLTATVGSPSSPLFFIVARGPWAPVHTCLHGHHLPSNSVCHGLLAAACLATYSYRPEC